MSLLMKALASAEKEKQEKNPAEIHTSVKETPKDLTLIALEDPHGVSEQPLEEEHPKNSLSKALKTAPASGQQKVAAQLLAANQRPKQNLHYVWLLLLLASLLILWFFAQQYLSIVNHRPPPDLVLGEMPKPLVAPVAPTTLAASTEVNQTYVEMPVQSVAHAPEPMLAIKADGPPALTNHQTTPTNHQKHAQNAENTAAKLPPTNVFNHPIDEALAEVDVSTKNNTQQNVSKTALLKQSSPKESALSLTRKSVPLGVDPTLLSAYQAFNRGENTLAQQQYRLVLQQDVRNIDALLGMAAIAQRQGRDADAAGWYQKVLEIEPKNSIAQSAMLTTQVNVNAVGTESYLKNLLAQQPEAANVHAALGNVYAAQNQWAQAQEAYFNANRYAANNADYAFNLAISLEHLGKSNLALAQYQRALDLLNKSGATSPDRTLLEARIKALQ